MKKDNKKAKVEKLVLKMTFATAVLELLNKIVDLIIKFN